MEIETNLSLGKEKREKDKCTVAESGPSDVSCLWLPLEVSCKLSRYKSFTESKPVELDIEVEFLSQKC